LPRKGKRREISSVGAQGWFFITRPTVVNRVIDYRPRAAPHIAGDIAGIFFPEAEMLQNLAEHLRILNQADDPKLLSAPWATKRIHFLYLFNQLSPGN
jgi:hypothetical protein